MNVDFENGEEKNYFNTNNLGHSIKATIKVVAGYQQQN